MNICTFSGRLTRDAELRYTTSGKGVVNFTLAVDFGFGENKGSAFIDCVKWNGEKLEPYLTKGKPVIVSGELQQESWQDKEGNKRSKLKLNIQSFDFQQGEKNQPAQRQEQERSSEFRETPTEETFPSEQDVLPF